MGKPKSLKDVRGLKGLDDLKPGQYVKVVRKYDDTHKYGTVRRIEYSGFMQYDGGNVVDNRRATKVIIYYEDGTMLVLTHINISQYQVTLKFKR